MDTETHKMLLIKAGALLARRAYSRTELGNRLTGLAADDQIEAALKHLEQLHLLNDGDYAYNFALHRIRQQGWSPAKVQHALLRHHIGVPIVECALERVKNEVGDQPTIILDYVQKHCGKKGLPADLKGIRKLILHLRQHGFDDENILSALRGVMPAAALQPFETGE
jgi:regulatory protein